MALYNNNSILKPQGAVTAADVDAVERRIGRTLPDALRAHYLDANGGKPEHSSCFYGENFELVVHNFLSMRPGGKGDFEDSFMQAKVDAPFLPPDLIPFAIDPGGDFFCISDAPPRAGQIFFFYSEEADDPEAATVRLAPSLPEFIENLRD